MTDTPTAAPDALAHLEGRIETERVPIDSLTPHPENPRIGDIPSIKASVRKFGQYRSIVVQRGTRHIIAGSHTWKAMVDLGHVECDAGFIEADDDEAKAILLTDNRLSELGAYDERKLLAALDSLDWDLDVTGWGAEAMDDLRRTVEGMDDPTRPDEGRGDLLELLNVTIDDPEHMPERGARYRLGDRHLLVVADVMKEHSTWSPLLHSDHIFVPYPGPLVALSERAEDEHLLMVQPDPYIAGHILQHWKDAGHTWEPWA